LLVTRSEYIGRKQRVEVPIWHDTRECFLIDSKKIGNNTVYGSIVDFAHPTNDAILVDFQGGDFNYERAEKKEDKPPVVHRLRDSARTEMVIFSPEGKLLVQDSANDSDNNDRKARLDAWRARVKEVRDGKTAGTGNPVGGNTGSPFGRP